jgi:ribosomal protein S18 acetylase RimI-like enzyme
MSELERASAFEEALRDSCAERVAETRFGPALFNDTYARVWNINALRVERPGAATAREVAAEADRVQGAAGLAHRRVLLPPGDDRLAAGFGELGWLPNHFVFMVRRRPPAHPLETKRVVEVEPLALEPLRHDIVREWLPGADDEELRQVIAADRLWWRLANGHCFAIVEGGTAVSAAVLFSDGRTAQVEDVATMPAHRGRGYASAVVHRAVEAALETRHDFVFLVADADDWPKELYRRLGFDEVGEQWAFVRPPADPDGTRPADRAP